MLQEEILTTHCQSNEDRLGAFVKTLTSKRIPEVYALLRLKTWQLMLAKGKQLISYNDLDS